MKKFEVQYKDRSNPIPTFMVVVREERLNDLKLWFQMNGYTQHKIQLLRGGK